MENFILTAGDLGKEIAKTRQELGLSQVETARLLGVDKRTLSAYERGTRRIHGTSLLKLAKIIDLSLDRVSGFRSPQVDGRTRRAYLMRKLDELEMFSPEDQKIILGMIDTMKQKYDLAESKA